MAVGWLVVGNDHAAQGAVLGRPQFKGSSFVHACPSGVAGERPEQKPLSGVSAERRAMDGHPTTRGQEGTPAAENQLTNFSRAKLESRGVAKSQYVARVRLTSPLDAPVYMSRINSPLELQTAATPAPMDAALEADVGPEVAICRVATSMPSRVRQDRPARMRNCATVSPVVAGAGRAVVPHNTFASDARHHAQFPEGAGVFAVHQLQEGLERLRALDLVRLRQGLFRAGEGLEPGNIRSPLPSAASASPLNTAASTASVNGHPQVTRQRIASKARQPVGILGTRKHGVNHVSLGLQLRGGDGPDRGRPPPPSGLFALPAGPAVVTGCELTPGA